MNPPASYFYVSTPALSFTFIGTSEPDGEHVWLCAPNGNRILRLPREQVHQSTPEETARRIVEDRKAELANRN